MCFYQTSRKEPYTDDLCLESPFDVCLKVHLCNMTHEQIFYLHVFWMEKLEIIAYKCKHNASSVHKWVSAGILWVILSLCLSELLCAFLSTITPFSILKDSLYMTLTFWTFSSSFGESRAVSTVRLTLRAAQRRPKETVLYLRAAPLTLRGCESLQWFVVCCCVATGDCSFML